MYLYLYGCFNSRTREGCDVSFLRSEYRRPVFQFTHPGGVRRARGVLLCLACVQFQFTHPGGVRHLDTRLIRSQGTFQFTHPGGVRRYTKLSDDRVKRFQFTHPGGVRRTSALAIVHAIDVSIHAPGRGATRQVCLCLALFVFQFTHPGGVRHDSLYVRYSVAEFQFTHPGGVRPEYVLEAHRPCCVSIHAPGRGATGELACRVWSELQFQFTHPGGVRQYGAKLRIMGRINKRNLRLEVLL